MDITLHTYYMPDDVPGNCNNANYFYLLLVNGFPFGSA